MAKKNTTANTIRYLKRIGICCFSLNIKLLRTTDAGILEHRMTALMKIIQVDEV